METRDESARFSTAYNDNAGRVCPAPKVYTCTSSSGSMVILSPGIYTVDIRPRASTSSASSRVIPNAGAAIWMPICKLPSSSSTTEKASSISVVVTSSIENACTVANGKFTGRGGSVIGAKLVPLGKCSNKKRDKCSSLAEAIPPVASISRAGLVCRRSQAASNALYSMEFLSGLNNKAIACPCMAAGRRCATSSST